MEGDLVRYIRQQNTGLISIHTLRMEGDKRFVLAHLHNHYFNPHPPHGG